MGNSDVEGDSDVWAILELQLRGKRPFKFCTRKQPFQKSIPRDPHYKSEGGSVDISKEVRFRPPPSVRNIAAFGPPPPPQIQFVEFHPDECS